MSSKSPDHLIQEPRDGKSLYSAMFSGLRMIVNKLSPRRGDVFYGHSMFRKPLLVSYSRSGTNWIRYFIEVTTDKATPGQKRYKSGRDYYIDRAHAGFVNMHKYSKVLLVLRNYKECLVRHHGIDKIRGDYKTIEDYLSDQQISQPPNWYFKNIAEFDKFNGDKLIVYYEDLLSHTPEILSRIGNFLQIEESKTLDFINNIDYHKAMSIKAYTSGGHKSMTQGKASSLIFHSQNLLDTEKTAFDVFFKSTDNYLFDKYLSRYDESGNR